MARFRQVRNGHFEKCTLNIENKIKKNAYQLVLAWARALIALSLSISQELGSFQRTWYLTPLPGREQPHTSGN